MIRCDVRRDLIKCDTNFDHGSNLNIANENLLEFDLILKLTDWNPKKIQSGNVYLL